MTVNQLIEKLSAEGLIDVCTRILINNEKDEFVACSNWYQDSVLNAGELLVKRFHWKDDPHLYIKVTEVRE